MEDKKEKTPSPAASDVADDEKKVDYDQDDGTGSSEKATTTATEREYASGLQLVTIMAGVTLVTLLMLLDVSIIVTAIPIITNQFHSLTDVGWYGASYQLAAAALQPLTGRVYANLNLKWTYLSFFFVFEVGSLICALATSSKMLIVGRAIAGMGTSGILNGVVTILAASLPMSRMPSLLGIVLGISQVGLAAGPLIGGALTQFTSWRWCFWINLPAGGVVGALLVFVHIPEPIKKDKFSVAIRKLPGKLDLIGFALFAPAAIQLLLALEYGGNKYAWDSSVVIGLFCGAGATFIVFCFWDHRMGDDAMIPFSMIRKKLVWSSTITYGLMMAQINLASYYLPIYFQGVKHADPLHSGIDVLPSVVAHLLVAFVAGKVVEIVGCYLPIIIISTMGMAIANGLLSTLTIGTSTGRWIGYQILLGFSRGLGLSVPIIAVQNILPPAQVPVATALIMFAQTFGGALFLSLGDTIFNASLRSLVRDYAPDVDPQTLIDAGATGFRSFVSDADLTGVLKAYSKSVDHVFYLATGMGCASFALCWFMGWNDIREKKKPQAPKKEEV